MAKHHQNKEILDVDEIHEQRAQSLKAALDALDVKSNVHWDRSPWGVRIGLVPGDYRDPTLEQPSLFVLTEGRQSIAGQWAWQWDLYLGNFGEYDKDRFEDLSGRILERTWLGEDVNKSAQIIKDYVFLLTMGARIAHIQRLADDQEGEHA